MFKKELCSRRKCVKEGINFVAYDLVEVMPTYDPANITLLLAGNLVHEFMWLIALQYKTASQL